MAYEPAYKVEWAPYDNPTSFTELKILHGVVVDDLDELSRSFDFHLPRDFDYALNEYGVTTVEMLQTGTRYRVKVTETGLFNGTDDEIVFIGSMQEVSPAFDSNAADISCKCMDDLARELASGVNLSWCPSMLLYEDGWDFDGSEWDASDPNFTVNLPDNGEEYVAQGMRSLARYRTVAAGDGDIDYHFYEPEEYSYNSSLKQLIFHESQDIPKQTHTPPPALESPNGERRWAFKLYYWDPLDTTHSIMKLMIAVATGNPLSKDGGSGFDVGMVDLKEVRSFQATGLTNDAYGYFYTSGFELRPTAIIREKTQGPIAQLWDELRDNGLLPRAYRRWIDPPTGELKGRYILQDNGAVLIPAHGVFSMQDPRTIEGMALRVEVQNTAGSPQNYAIGATVTTNPPVSSNPGGSFDGLTYTQVGANENANDGNIRSQIQFQLEVTTLDFDPQSGPPDMFVHDLGQVRDVGIIQVWGAFPTDADDPTIDPRDGTPIYLVSRMPRMTICASENPITTSNPGTPIGPDAINRQFSPQDGNNLALEAECVWVRRMRYIAVTMDQDFFYRRDGNHIGATGRESWFGYGELKALGIGLLNYRDGEDPDSVPFAQLTNKGATISAIAGAGPFVLTVPAGHNIVATDRVVFYDTSGAAPFTFAVQTVSSVTATSITVPAVPGGLVATDKIGWYKRWQQGALGVWFDFCLPKLYAKLLATKRPVDHLTDIGAADYHEGDFWAAERLKELTQVGNDKQIVIPLDIRIKTGKTVDPDGGGQDWLVRKTVYNLNEAPKDEGEQREPMVTQTVEGSDYEQVAQ